MKKIKKTIYYFIGFVALLFAFTVTINLPVFDEDLLPEVAAIKNIEANPFGEQDALPAIIAINGPSSISLQAAAKPIRKFLNQKIKNTGIDYLTDDEYKNLVGDEQYNTWPEGYSSCNSRTDLDCMGVVYSEFETSPIAGLGLQDQLNRYQELIAMSHYSDYSQLDINAPFPAFSLTLSLKKIYLAESYANQGSEVFFEIVMKDMMFWRMVLNNSHLMLTKMVSVASLYDSIGGLSAAIKSNHFNSQQLRQLQQLKPLNQIESNISRTIEFEFKFGLDMVDDIDQEDAIGMSHWINFFQPNATHNISYQKLIQPVLQVAAMNAADFHQYQLSDQASKEFESPFSWTPTALYNPTGKMMVSFSPAYTDYIGRVHDLSGMIHLLQLQIELALNPEQSIQQLINDSQWFNPYTSAPMSFDAGTKRIYFTCMDKTSSCELLL